MPVSIWTHERLWELNPSRWDFSTTTSLTPGWPHISFPTVLKIATLRASWFYLSFQSHMLPNSPCHSFSSSFCLYMPSSVCLVWQPSGHSRRSDSIICLLFSPNSEDGNFINFSDKAQRLWLALSVKLKKKHVHTTCVFWSFCCSTWVIRRWRELLLAPVLASKWHSRSSGDTWHRSVCLPNETPCFFDPVTKL